MLSYNEARVACLATAPKRPRLFILKVFNRTCVSSLCKSVISGADKYKQLKHIY